VNQHLVAGADFGKTSRIVAGWKLFLGQIDWSRVLADYMRPKKSENNQYALTMMKKSTTDKTTARLDQKTTLVTKWDGLRMEQLENHGNDNGMDRIGKVSSWTQNRSLKTMMTKHPRSLHNKAQLIVGLCFAVVHLLFTWMWWPHHSNKLESGLSCSRLCAVQPCQIINIQGCQGAFLEIQEVIRFLKDCK
jgi:hypothetical protein